MPIPYGYFTSSHENLQGEYLFNFQNYTPTGISGGVFRIQLTRGEIQHESCPKCNCQNCTIHEYKQRVIVGGTWCGIPVYYETDQIRYYCPDCDSTFVERHGILPWRKGLIQETEDYIIRMLGSVSMSMIAENIGVSVQTIANRAIEYGSRERKIMLGCSYKYLSMDEVFIGHNKNGDHKIYWLLNDNSVPWKSNNIMIGIGRKKEDVIERLKYLKNPDKVVAVSIDMWNQYRDAVACVFPRAAIVVDRFHVIKNAEENMNDIRKKVKCSKDIKAEMKKDASLFLKSFYKLTPDELDRLDGYLGLDKKLETAYYLIQELLEFYNIYGYEEALDYLCKWESKVIASGMAESLTIYQTVYNWLPYIMNFFKYRITNGKTEGKNNLLRTIDRIGFHYGLDCLQACLYAHDRIQELAKWRKYQKRLERKAKAISNSSNKRSGNIAA